MYILSINDDDQVVINAAGVGFENARVITSEEDLQEFLHLEALKYGVLINELTVMASSSIDFPNEYTDNPETIALARALR